MIKEKIAEIAESKNINISELAILIDVKRPTLLYHLANNNVPLDYLNKIARALDCKVSDLVDDEDMISLGGKVKLKKQNYNMTNMNDFARFIDELAIECGLESDLSFDCSKKNLNK